MAANQTNRHALGRLGQEIVKAELGGEPTSHKAPFDLVDFNKGIAYEVKTMMAGTELKIHISKESMSRKRAFLKEYHLKGTLIAVVIHGPDEVNTYTSALKQSKYVSQMKAIK